MIQKITNIVKKAALKVVSENINDKDMTMGAEDMSFFLEKVPGCYFMVGSANKEKGFDKPHHSPYFDFDEELLLWAHKYCLTQFFEYFDKLFYIKKKTKSNFNFLL